MLIAQLGTFKTLCVLSPLRIFSFDSPCSSLFCSVPGRRKPRSRASRRKPSQNYLHKFFGVHRHISLHGQNLNIGVKSVWSYFPLTCFARLLRNSFAKGDPEQPLTDPINSSSKQFSQAAGNLSNPILMTRERPKFFF